MNELPQLWFAEWIVIGFFIYLIVLARIFPLGNRARLRILAVGIICSSLIIMLSQLQLSPTLRFAREWLPVIYLVQGYWCSAVFFRQPTIAVEESLANVDHVLFQLTKITTLLTRGPRLLLEYLELTHVLSYPMVIINFGLFYWMRLSTDADYFWTAVLLAGYGCYGCLPWLQIRTPLYLEQNRLHTKHDLFFRRLNFFVRNMASMHVSTFPSSHIAINVAATLVIISMNSTIGMLSVILTTSMAISTVFGRYHYSLDSIFGVLFGVIGWWIGIQLTLM